VAPAASVTWYDLGSRNYRRRVSVVFFFTEFNYLSRTLNPAGAVPAGAAFCTTVKSVPVAAWNSTSNFPTGSGGKTTSVLTSLLLRATASLNFPSSSTSFSAATSPSLMAFTGSVAFPFAAPPAFAASPAALAASSFFLASSAAALGTVSFI
jgi:hypothetical protein